tara:strand:- start:8256 stop:9296 length:1041 start_codon:yes stop_codon:yes gene_type:complete
MTENWEFALSHVQEGWVTVIGDDDAVLPGGIERMLAIANRANVSAVRSATHMYHWPSILEGEFGSLNLQMRTGHRVIKTAPALQSVLDGKSYYKYSLPVLYTGGFVRTEILARLRARTGRVFNGIAPDVYSSIAISQEIDRFVYLYEPLAIDGQSKHSGGRAALAPAKLNGTHYLEPAKKFISELGSSRHPKAPLHADGSIPRSLQLVFFEAFCQASSVLDLANFSFDPAAQLALIEEEARWSRQSVNLTPWIPEFCAANEIGPGDAKRWRRWAKRNLWQRQVKLLFLMQLSVSKKAGDLENPLKTIEDAIQFISVWSLSQRDRVREHVISMRLFLKQKLIPSREK